MISQVEIGRNSLANGATAECDVVLLNRSGLNLPEAMSLAQAAGRHQAEVVVENGSEAADGRSILDLLLLEARAGSRLHIRASGPDARPLVEELAALVAGRFGEQRPRV